jgi:hypothetical protein
LASFKSIQPTFNEGEHWLVDASISDNFIPIESRIEPKTREKSTYGSKGIEIAYEPWEGEEEWVNNECTGNTLGSPTPNSIKNGQGDSL